MSEADTGRVSDIDPASLRLDTPQQATVVQLPDRRREKRERRRGRNDPPSPKFARFNEELTDAVTGIHLAGLFFVLWLLQSRFGMSGGKSTEIGNKWLAEHEVDHKSKKRVLQELEARGLIAVDWRDRRSPIITPLSRAWWWPEG
jgi:hypothetical protein